jgi:ATP-dependent 26S proteasome regulatory subunit
MSVVGILADDTDPMVSVMKVEKAPLESYADIGGLHEQVSKRLHAYMISYLSVAIEKLR